MAADDEQIGSVALDGGENLQPGVPECRLDPSAFGTGERELFPQPLLCLAAELLFGTMAFRRRRCDQGGAMQKAMDHMDGHHLRPEPAGKQ